MRRPAIAILAAILLSAPPAWAQTGARIASAARGQVGVTTIYDPAYVQLRYPNGDLPMVRGVCADVIVRAFRGIGVDLQAELHNDMARNFAALAKEPGDRPSDAGAWSSMLAIALESMASDVTGWPTALGDVPQSVRPLSTKRLRSAPT